MQPNPTKIQTLQDLPTPESPVKLQSFLGLINYLQPLIPWLANNTTFLWEQTAQWDWNPSTHAVFQCLKAWICLTLLNTMLACYDQSKPIIVQTNAIKYSLSAALIQCSRPIAFTNKTLTDIETHYANVKKECLSVHFGLEKFHTYLYGRYVIIENDHKPLEMTQHKHIHATPLAFSACFYAWRSTTT